MKILFLTLYFPYPMLNGAQVRTYNIIKRLGKKHEIHLFGYIGDQVSPSDIRHMDTFCASASDRRVPDKNSIQAYGRSLLQNLPYKIVHTYDAQFHQELNSLAAKEKFDLVFIDHLFLSRYKISEGQIPHVMTFQNLEHRLLEKYARGPWGMRRLYGWSQAEKIKKYEMDIGKAFDGCIYVSEIEEQIVKARHPEMRSITVPNGADIDFYQPAFTRETSGPRMVFVGNYVNFPNTEAVHGFMTDIFPLIRRKVPLASFDVVGFKPPASLRAYEGPGVRIIGHVQDPRESIARASVVVVPLRSGAGTKLKVLEAMAMGKAIVTTSVGADGLQVQDGKDLFIADEPSLFAEHVVRLLEDEDLRSRFETTARNTAARLYGWDPIVDQLDTFLNEVVRKESKVGGGEICAGS